MGILLCKWPGSKAQIEMCFLAFINLGTNCVVHMCPKWARECLVPMLLNFTVLLNLSKTTSYLENINWSYSKCYIYLDQFEDSFQIWNQFVKNYKVWLLTIKTILSLSKHFVYLFENVRPKKQLSSILLLILNLKF